MEQSQALAKHDADLDDESKLSAVFTLLRDLGWTFNDLFSAFMSSGNQQRSSQATRFLASHGPSILDSMTRRKPDVVHGWAIGEISGVLQREAAALSEMLKPGTVNLAGTVSAFSLQDISATVRDCAPTLWRLLESMGATKTNASTRRNRALVYTTIACMIAQCRNERSNMFQRAMSFWLYAGGAGKQQFDVLHHAGLCTSYSKMTQDLESLSNSMLDEVRSVAKKSTVMVVWDNLNIAFKVSEQRMTNKAHFDNGTTASMIVLEGVPVGTLRTDMVPPRVYRTIQLPFSAEDVLPSPEVSQELANAHLYHIVDILFNAFPTLRALFNDKNPVPVKDRIPLHKTRHYALPAMKIDESSLDGTLDVVETIIKKTLDLNDDDVKKQGVILCAGDQLTISLLDKASASRRDDTVFLDNIGKFTEGQPGLFHGFMNSTRMIANEYWGGAGLAPWSLWKANSILGRKNISCGWKAKQLAPFWPLQELILNLSLPANILDAFRLHVPNYDLDSWVAKVASYEEVKSIAEKVQRELTSRRKVYTMRRKPDDERDFALENVILFNNDALTLREFQHAVRDGDIGRVVNVLTLWMLEFRGTGSMPKYADMLYRVLKRLKEMHPALREAFLRSWLVNVTGKEGRFKAVDLLQEHLNFWAKLIYMAKGSNRSWKWLSMVTLCIWALRDVLRNVQSQFKVRHNGTSHTSPGTDNEIAKLRAYLEEGEIQRFWPARPHNDRVTPARDLIAQGASFFNTSAAAKQYRRDIRRATFKKSSTSTQTDNPANPQDSQVNHEEMDTEKSEDQSGDTDDELWAQMEELTPEELAYDCDEYTDAAEFNALIDLAREILAADTD
ncbi:hypothetical protein SCHPADRAFT_832004 [Schizopora paradoxa]|uniref:DUF6589 domain-containing protein n=1 Tax=Schizopora paradoxa TaxID=27342 RepID=A0A0H2RG38_9AGAM|nr:hypothetical protein SCHPADRAFT_832004 [Schizopora paradoxa]